MDSSLRPELKTQQGHVPRPGNVTPSEFVVNRMPAGDVRNHFFSKQDVTPTTRDPSCNSK